MAEEVKKKRGPGRPPSDSKKPEVKREGVCDVPKKADNCIELYYAIPLVLRRLFNLYKAAGITEIVMEFSKESMVWFAKSKNHPFTIRTTIDCTKMHRYYCAEEKSIVISRSNAADVINRIDGKCFTSIIIDMKNLAEEVSSININLINPELGWSKHRINVKDKVTEPDETVWDETGYAVSFKMDSKEFKKYMSDAKSISDTLTIEKEGTKELKFKYSKDANAVEVVDTLKNSKKIDLQSTIAETDILATSLKLAELQQLSNVQLTDDVRIYIDAMRDPIFMYKMDPAITTKVMISRVSDK